MLRAEAIRTIWATKAIVIATILLLLVCAQLFLSSGVFQVHNDNLVRVVATGVTSESSIQSSHIQRALLHIVCWSLLSLRSIIGRFPATIDPRRTVISCWGDDDDDNGPC
jgi:hypothetical protein